MCGELCGTTVLWETRESADLLQVCQFDISLYGVSLRSDIVHDIN